MRTLDDEYDEEDLRDLIEEELAAAPEGAVFIATALDEDDSPVMVVGVRDGGRVSMGAVNLTEDILQGWCSNLGYHVERVQ